MAKTIKAAGYDNLKTTLSALGAGKQINIYFTGSKSKNGVSWCRQCAEAEPHVFDAVQKFAGKESVFIIADIGDKSFWKDIKNPFRTDKEIFISVIPTLIRWKGAQRLEGMQCKKTDLLEMFLTN